MAKLVKMTTIAQIDAKLEKMLVDRAERLRTKCYPRPDKFDAEMKESETVYRWRLISDAAKKYVRDAMKAEGFSVEILNLPEGYRAGSFVMHGTPGSENSGYKGAFATVINCDNIDCDELVKAMAKYDITVNRRLSNVGGIYEQAGFDRRGYDKETIEFYVPDFV